MFTFWAYRQHDQCFYSQTKSYLSITPPPKKIIIKYLPLSSPKEKTTSLKHIDTHLRTYVFKRATVYMCACITFFLKTAPYFFFLFFFFVNSCTKICCTICTIWLNSTICTICLNKHRSYCFLNKKKDQKNMFFSQYISVLLLKINFKIFLTNYVFQGNWRAPLNLKWAKIKKSTSVKLP